MSHFAQVKNGVVTQVITAEKTFIDALPDKGDWIQTSYRTFAGQHPLGLPLHKNFAGVGYHFDGIGFYEPKPYRSWVLNRTSYLWEAPIPCPSDGKIYNWDESTTSWVEIIQP